MSSCGILRFQTSGHSTSMNIPAHMVNGLKFSGAEQLDLANEELGWNVEWRQLRPGDFEARLNYTCGGDFHYMSERFSRALHILAEPPEEAVGLVLPVIDYSQASVSGKPLQNHEIILFPPGSELDFVSMGNAGCESFFLPETLFESILESLYPDTKLLQHGTAEIFQVNVAECMRLRRAIAMVQLSNHSTPEENSLIFARAIRAIVESLSRDKGGGPSGLHSAALVARRARDYMEEHYSDSLCIEELTRYTGSSLRTLQRSFASYFDVNRTQYLKAMRFHKARLKLHSAEPEGESVTQIAMDCGLQHLGRFSVEYRQYFGESPRQTLGRKKSLFLGAAPLQMP